MSLIAVAGTKGSPGASVSSLALAWSWPQPVILAECDPAGSDMVPGVLQGQLEASRSIGELPVLHARQTLDAEFFGQLIDLDSPHLRRLLLPGVAKLSDAAGVATSAEPIASFFASLAHADPAYDVIADCGRLNAAYTMWPLLRRADVVLLVVTGTMQSLRHADMAIADWRDRFAGDQQGDALRLLVIERGPHWRQAGKQLGVPVLGTLPDDARAARPLTIGPVDAVRANNPLVRAWRGLHPALMEAVKDTTVGRGVREVAHAL